MTTVAVAQGSRSQLLYKKQSGLGTAATGNYKIARINSHSINPAIDTIESGEIRSDREVYDYRHGNRQARGNTVHELSYGILDDLIESAFFSTFSGATTDNDGLIQIGTSPQYLSMEDGALDLSVYRPFYDMICSRIQFRFGTGANAMVMMNCDWVGLSGGNPASATIGGTPVAPATSRRPFDSYNGALYDNTQETGEQMIEVTSMDLTIDNGANPIFGFGQQTGISLEYGRGRVSGNMTMYYTQRSRQTLDRFLREIEGFLVMNIVADNGQNMEFRIPRVKFNGGDVPLANERSRIITLPFVGLKGGSQNSALWITKFAS